MSKLLNALLHFLFHIGYWGPVLMGVMDSSFLFLPFGNDLLVVALVARRRQGFLLYALAAACGSTLGVVLLDLAARRLGGDGVKKMAGKGRFDYLKKKIGEHGTAALIVGCLAPPPFPFTMAVATLSALKYSRVKMLVTVWAARLARFLFLGWLAMRYGRLVIRVAKSPAFTYTMGVLVALCVAGSVFSIWKWVRRGKGRRPEPEPAGAESS